VDLEFSKVHDSLLTVIWLYVPCDFQRKVRNVNEPKKGSLWVWVTLGLLVTAVLAGPENEATAEPKTTPASIDSTPPTAPELELEPVSVAEVLDEPFAVDDQPDDVSDSTLAAESKPDQEFAKVPPMVHTAAPNGTRDLALTEEEEQKYFPAPVIDETPKPSASCPCVAETGACECNQQPTAKGGDPVSSFGAVSNDVCADGSCSPMSMTQSSWGTSSVAGQSRSVSSGRVFQRRPIRRLFGRWRR